MLLFLSCGSVSYATTCDCRPEFNTEAEGNGWCSRTKENGAWCKLTFNEESVRQTDQRQKFITAIKPLGISGNIFEATQTLNKVPPLEWKVDYVDNHFPVLFSIALWNVAPDRLKEIATILRKNRDILFKLVTGSGGSSESEGYVIDGSAGCLQFRKGPFSTMVRTVFAPIGRFSFFDDPRNSPFVTCFKNR